MALVVLSERSPLNALESVLRRCAYVLLPFSLLLIKYFPALGVGYSWDGVKMWVGVTMQKNALGAICALSAFLIVWALHREWRAGALLKCRSQVFADGLILAIALYILNGFQSYAATAMAILGVGITSLLVLYRMKNYTQRMAHLLVFGVVFVLLTLWTPIISDSIVPTVTSIFGRKPSFTGRTEIWDAVLHVASRQPLLGVGYGGYWGLQDRMIYSTLGVRESHSGYLDVYLEGGMIGLVLLGAFLLTFYRKSLRELDHAYDWGLLGICLLVMTLMHNFTESNFLRTSSYFWNSTVFVAVVFSAPYLYRNGGCSD